MIWKQNRVFRAGARTRLLRTAQRWGTYLAVLVVVSATSGNAARAVTIFTDRTAFDAAVAGLQFDVNGLVFESFETSFPLTDSVIFGPVTITEINAVPLLSSGNQIDIVTDGLRAVNVHNPTTPPTDVRFTFDSPINVFGVDIKDWGDGDPGILSVTNNTGSVNSVLGTSPPGLPTENVIFFGVIDETPFTSVTFDNTTGGDGYGLDALNFGAVPEPSTFMLAGLGLVTLVAYGWRRRRTAIAQA